MGFFFFFGEYGCNFVFLVFLGDKGRGEVPAQVRVDLSVCLTYCGARRREIRFAGWMMIFGDFF